MKEKKFRYSEIFGETIQGEGQYTGVPTIWVRFWGCNFSCQGFGQKNPGDPSTWETEYENLDLTDIKSMEDVPILKFGCDSAYSWAKKFQHLVHQETPREMVDKLEKLMIHETNPDGKFIHPRSKQSIHMAFTGGEPMMNQTAICEIFREFVKRSNVPSFVTVETNGTQRLRPNAEELINAFKTASECGGLVPDEQGPVEWFWSVSPKLYASGESWEKAIKAAVLRSYADASDNGQLKYVVDGSERSWDEVERATNTYRDVGIEWPVWIMPVGSSGEQQEEIQARICEETVRRGYNFSARIHSWIFNNAIGK